MCLIPWLGRGGHQTQLAKKMTVYLLTRQIFAIGNTISLSHTHSPSEIQFPGLLWWSSGYDSALPVQGLRFDPWSGKISHILWCAHLPPAKKRGRTVSLSLSPLPLQWEPLLVFPLVSCYCSLQMHPWVEPYHSVRSPPHRFISVSSFWFSPCNVSLFLWFPCFSFVKWTPATEYTCIYALLSAYLLVKTKQNKKNTFVSVN